MSQRVTHLAPGAGPQWSEIVKAKMEGLTGRPGRERTIGDNAIRLYDVWTVDGQRLEIEARTPTAARAKAKALGYVVDAVELVR